MAVRKRPPPKGDTHATSSIGVFLFIWASCLVMLGVLLFSGPT